MREKKVEVNWQAANKTFTVEHETKEKVTERKGKKRENKKKYIDDM